MQRWSWNWFTSNMFSVWCVSVKCWPLVTRLGWYLKSLIFNSKYGLSQILNLKLSPMFFYAFQFFQFLGFVSALYLDTHGMSSLQKGNITWFFISQAFHLVRTFWSQLSVGSISDIFLTLRVKVNIKVLILWIRMSSKLKPSIWCRLSCKIRFWIYLFNSPDVKLHQDINRESISDYPFAGQQPVTLAEEKDKEVSLMISLIPRFCKNVRSWVMTVYFTGEGPQKFSETRTAPHQNQ